MDSPTPTSPDPARPRAARAADVRRLPVKRLLLAALLCLIVPAALSLSLSSVAPADPLPARTAGTVTALGSDHVCAVWRVDEDYEPQHQSTPLSKSISVGDRTLTMTVNDQLAQTTLPDDESLARILRDRGDVTVKDSFEYEGRTWWDAEVIDRDTASSRFTIAATFVDIPTQGTTGLEPDQELVMVENVVAKDDEDDTPASARELAATVTISEEGDACAS
ncbi:MAG: hypothetical protein Q4G34_07790 [Micrococcus sp.]|nr:hypothetical protein [Micrococcus sp.]